MLKTFGTTRCTVGQFIVSEKNSDDQNGLGAFFPIWGRGPCSMCRTVDTLLHPSQWEFLRLGKDVTDAHLFYIYIKLYRTLKWRKNKWVSFPHQRIPTGSTKLLSLEILSKMIEIPLKSKLSSFSRKTPDMKLISAMKRPFMTSLGKESIPNPIQRLLHNSIIRGREQPRPVCPGSRELLGQDFQR